MAVSIKSRPRPTGQREYRYTREDYAALAETGLFEGTKVELIRGRLIEMPPISEDHGDCVLRAARTLRRRFPEDKFTVRPGLPFIAVDDSEPEPDLCVVSGSIDDITGHPSSCILLIEISFTTLAFDRREKASLYAESGVQDYWIVNLVDRVIERHREPLRRDDGSWGYASIDVKRPGETIDLDAVGTIDVSELLPRPTR